MCFVAACQASHYGLLLSDGPFVKFDLAGDEKAVEAFKATARKSNLTAQASGARSGNALKVETLAIQ